MMEPRPNTAGEQPNQMLGSDIKMALARNFAKKVANSKKINEETKESVTLLRNQFMQSLAKVYDNATMKDGVLLCHRIIQSNVLNPASLRVILAALCDRSS